MHNFIQVTYCKLLLLCLTFHCFSPRRKPKRCWQRAIFPMGTVSFAFMTLRLVLLSFMLMKMHKCINFVDPKILPQINISHLFECPPSLPHSLDVYLYLMWTDAGHGPLRITGQFLLNSFLYPSLQEDEVFTKTSCYHYFHSHCLGRYVTHSERELRERERELEEDKTRERTEEEVRSVPLMSAHWHKCTWDGTCVLLLSGRRLVYNTRLPTICSYCIFNYSYYHNIILLTKILPSGVLEGVWWSV